MRQNWRDLLVPALGCFPGAAPPPRSTTARARPVRGNGLYRPGAVHHDGRPTGRPSAGLGPIKLPRNQSAHLRPIRATASPASGSSTSKPPTRSLSAWPAPVPSALPPRAVCCWNMNRRRRAPNGRPADHRLRRRAALARTPSRLVHNPRDTGRHLPTRATRHTRTLPHRTIHSLHACKQSAIRRARYTTRPIPSNQRSFTQSMKTSWQAGELSDLDIAPLTHFSKALTLKSFALRRVSP